MDCNCRQSMFGRPGQRRHLRLGWLLLVLPGVLGCGRLLVPWSQAGQVDSVGAVTADSQPDTGGSRSAGKRSWASPVGWRQVATRVLPTKQPSHDRNWRPDLMILPHADIRSDRVLLYNIRDCVYRSEEDYDVRHYDRQVMLDDVRTIDFIVVPFKDTPAIAHTMLSFGLADGEHIVFSVEARLEQGENYAALPSANKQFELMWVVGTEPDLIRLRTDVRDVDVYLYPIRATPEQVQRVFLASVARVNQIARQPEFYDLLTNNCTTNIVDMVNSLKPGVVPRDVRVLLPGHSDRLAYELGLVAMDGPFEQIKSLCRINTAARLHADSPNFSALIRLR